MKNLLNFLYKQKNILLIVILIAVFLNAVLLTPTIKQAFEYNTDEGTDLMKALLFQKGYALYTEIWNDQPPLFTVIISFWIKLFGTSIQQIRILGTLFSIILLFSLFKIVKIKKGKVCAFITIILLLSSTAFLRLSAGLMLGMAAFSFAILSILCVVYYEKFPQKRLLILSGFFMALSLQTKLYATFLIPLILLEISFFSNAKTKTATNTLSTLLLWVSSLALTYLSIIILFFKNDFSLLIEQLIAPHAARININKANFSVIWKMLIADYGITLLALLSSFTIILKKNRKLFLFPLLWAFSALIILMIHKPIWHHYYIFISIPFCWLAAIRINDFFHIGILKKRVVKNNHPGFINICIHWITGILIILILFELPHTYNKIVKSLNKNIVKEEKEIINIISKYKTTSQWLVTDRPIFAYYTNMLVPPELILVSHKRNFTSLSAQEYFIKKLKKYNPGLILLNKSNYYGQDAINYIEDNYINIYNGTVPIRVWRNKSLRTYPHGPYSLFKDFITNPWFISQHIKQTNSKKLHTLTFFETLLTKQISAYSNLKKNQLFHLNKSSLYPMTISKDGVFKTKSYHFLKSDCLKYFPTKKDKMAAYKLIKKEITDWKKEQIIQKVQNTPLDLNLIITRLNSLKNKVADNITQEKRYIYLKSTKKNPIRDLKIIKLYLRKDILPVNKDDM